MKKILFSLIMSVAVIGLMHNDAKAQEYKNAIGGRFGSANGISFKTSLNKKAMLELIGNFREYKDVHYFSLTGLYEVYTPIKDVQGLNWFYGGGASIGSAKVKGFDGDFYLSANGVLGLDYKFNGVPINLSLDWIPALQLTPNTGFWGGDVGVGVRFTF